MSKKTASILFFFAIFIALNPLLSHAEVTKEAINTRDAYAPFEELIQVTPSDATVYSPPLRGCIIEVGGDIVLNTSKGDSSVTITVVAGQLIPAMITKVLAATTATAVCGR